MKIYCMCGHNKFVAINNLKSTLKSDIKDDVFYDEKQSELTVVSLCIPMQVESCGIAQIILGDGNNSTSRHYPNVDIRVCGNCGNRIAIG